MLGLIGKKLGMTQVYIENGQQLPVTVIEVLPTKVMEIKTEEKHGYKAIKVAAGTRKEKHVTKPVAGQFKKAGIALAEKVMEFRLDDVSGFEAGQEIDFSAFIDEKLVTVEAFSKGHGFAGTIKRYNYSRGPETHGSKNVRAPGSLGAHSYPARVFPGKTLPGHYGDAKVTVKNLKLVKIDAENRLLFIQGAVPGATNGNVIVRKQRHG
jgi:large subunit ribosomal protein L3